jgi:hypothetical protein
MVELFERRFRYGVTKRKVLTERWLPVTARMPANFGIFFMLVERREDKKIVESGCCFTTRKAHLCGAI